MKVIACITADFERSFLGLPSRLSADLCGETVLRRTIRRLRRTPGLAGIHLLVDASQEQAARSAVAGLDVSVETHNAGTPPWSRYVASGRKWALDAWRGGLAGATVYDEFAHPWLLEALARREGADAVVDVPAAAPLLDPELLRQLLDYYATVCDEARLGMVQSAPGLSAVIYHPELLAGLTQVSQPPGRALAYRPDNPQKDAIHQPCWFAADATIAHGWGRCIADTCTAFARVQRIISELGAADPEQVPDALPISRWLLANWRVVCDRLPREVEIEITTQDPLADSPLRPRGKALQRNGEMDLPTFRRIIDELADCDDRLIVLGGFGDPLLHPRWPEFVKYARQRGMLGMALRTTGANLDDAAIEVLLESEVDVLNVLLDAATPGTYLKLHNRDLFEQVTANIDRLCGVQQDRQRPRPLIACEMLKTAETMDEMEPFYDRWMGKTASAVISGPSNYAGQWPDRAVVRMAPPSRFACGRLAQRTLILADGRMTLCDQDFRGQHAIGSVHGGLISDLWQGPALNSVRAKQAQGDYAGLPLCAQCDEWHRP